MFMAVFIRGLTRSLTKLFHHVVRGLLIAVHAGDEIGSGFQLLIRGVTKVEDVGFTTRVKAVVEIVRGVSRIRERGIIDGHFREGQSVVPVVSVEVGSAKKLLHGLVGTLREAIGLGVVRRGGHVTNAEFRAEQLPPVTGEAGVTIRDDAPRKAMKANNVPEHQVRGVFGTLILASGDEMNHTRCSVGNGKNSSESLAVARHLEETEVPVHTDRLPFPCGEG